MEYIKTKIEDVFILRPRVFGDERGYFMETFRQEKKAVMAQAKEEAKALLQASNAKIENTIRAIREAQADKEKTREARRQLGEFKEQALNATEKEDRIARKIAKIKRRQERKQQKEQAPSNASGLGAILGALGQMNRPAENTA